MKLVVNHELSELEDDPASGKKLKILKDMVTILSMAVESLEAAESMDIEKGLNFYAEVRRFEIGLIRRALKKTGGNQSQAARLLGLNQTTLHGKIKQYKISPNVLVYASEDFIAPGDDQAANEVTTRPS
jgi:DNA-binding NtrC family response regulator